MPLGMLTVFRLDQSSKALVPILLTELGMLMVSRLVHPLKASWVMLVMEVGIYTSSRLVQPSKILFAILSMLVVKAKRFREVQFLNATHPMAFTLLGNSISSSAEQS